MSTKCKIRAWVPRFTNALGVRVDYYSSQVCGCTCDVPLQLHYEMLQLALMSTMEILPWRMFSFLWNYHPWVHPAFFFNQYMFILYHLLRFCLVNLLQVMKSSWPLFRLKGFPSISAITLGVQVHCTCSCFSWLIKCWYILWVSIGFCGQGWLL